MLPPLGPTASNAQGPYGPYWPNGTYIPYRPAALRDPRYYSQFAPHFQWSGQHGARIVGDNTFRHAGNTPWSSFPDSTGFDGSLKPNQNYDGSLSGMTPALLPGDGSLHPMAQRQSNIAGSFLQGTPNGVVSNSSYHSLDSDPSLDFGPAYYRRNDTLTSTDSGQSTPRADQSHALSPLAEFGGQSSNAVVRERAATWAHSIYIDLLKYLHQTRRHGSNNRHSHGHAHPHRPTIYPKPPRQPGSDFSSLLSGRRRSYPGSNQDVSKPKPSLPHANSDFIQQHRSQQLDPFIGQASKRRMIDHAATYPTWSNSPAMNGYPSPNHNQFRSLPLTHSAAFGSPSLSPIGAPYSELPPKVNAAHALEYLSQLCQESNWEWIDGMLLGGCLAYALGDYAKALKWYSKILEVDSK